MLNVKRADAAILPGASPRERSALFPAVLPFLAALALFAACALSGCAISYAPNEPTSATEPLVVGQLRLIASGFPAAMAANGSYGENIQIELRNLATGRRYGARSTGPDGMVMLAGLPPGGPYAIVGFKAVLPAGWGTAQIVTYNPPHPLTFAVRPGVVNNIGLIVWRIDQASGRQRQEAGSGYAAVRESFRERWARSAWVRFRWESREL